MDEHRSLLALLLSLSFWRDFLEVDHELLGIMLGIGEEFRGIQGKNMVGNSFRCLAQAARIMVSVPN